jgi:predicted naringenin-chalcone synthase
LQSVPIVDLSKPIASILGIGTSLPKGSLTQQEAARVAADLRRIDDGKSAERRRKVLNALYRRSGVSRRQSVLLAPGAEDPTDRQSFYKVTETADDKGPTTAERMHQYAEHAPGLATEACLDALKKSGLTAEQIDHLVTVSCSGFSAPGFDLKLFETVGLGSTTSRTHVGFMGCHAALNGLRVADAYATARPGAKVLVCATELCSVHHQYTDDPQQIVANSLFADGAAAMVVTVPEAHSDANAWQMIEQLSNLMPDSGDLMTWSVGDHGFNMTLSPQVPEQIEQHLKPWLLKWLARHDLTIESIDHWAVHPGGPRILTATAESLGIPREALAVSDQVLSECGNMSSPTILFILDRLVQADVRGTCLALAFGPGLVVESALLQR